MDDDNLEEIDQIEEIDLGAWRVQDVINSLKSKKRGKAAAVDEVGSDVLRRDIVTIETALARVYNKLWNAEKWPGLWKKGLILKIFKKGSLLDYNN